VAVGMEVGVPSLTVAVDEKVRLFPLAAFGVRLGGFDPLLARGLQVSLHHLRRLAFDTAGRLPRNGKEQLVRLQSVLRVQPGVQPLQHVGMQNLGVGPLALAVDGLHGDDGRFTREIE
jgi:hypothetical protein